jgi:prephenate dehydrogenase
MEVLIGGGAGEVGGYLAEDFSLQGHKGTILDRKPEDRSMSQRRAITFFQYRGQAFLNEI